MSWNSLRSSTRQAASSDVRLGPAGQPLQRAERLGRDEVALGAAVRALRAALGGERRAVQLQVQLARPRRQALGLLRAVEEAVDPAEALDGQRREAVERGDALDHLLGRPAAAVAVADREQALRVRVPPARAGPGLQRGARPGDAVVAALGVVEHVGEDAAAVEPLPPEQVVREPVGLRPRQLDREEPLDARAAQQLGQRGREAEAVGQPADGVRRAEALGEVALAVEELADQRLAGRHHAVRLHPHAADRLEAALGGKRLDPAEQLRVVLFEEREHLGGRLVEVQLRVALEQPDRRPQRPPRLAARLGERPAPRQVQVGVGGQRQRAGRRVALGDPPQLARPGTPPRRRPSGARRRRARAAAGPARPAAPRRSADPRSALGGRRTAAWRWASRARATRSPPRRRAGRRRRGRRRARGRPRARGRAGARASPARRRPARRAPPPAARRGWASRTGAARPRRRARRTAWPRAGAHDARDPSRRTSRSRRRRRASPAPRRRGRAAGGLHRRATAPRPADARSGGRLRGPATARRGRAARRRASSRSRSIHSRSRHERSSSIRAASQSSR